MFFYKKNYNKWVWQRLNLPRKKFVSWLAMLGKLATKNNLVHFGVVTDDLCPLCWSSTKSVHHLFFICQYSKLCQRGLELWLQQRLRLTSIHDIDPRKWHAFMIKRQAVVVSICSLIYHLWQARNEAIWHYNLKHPDVVLRSIVDEVQLRMRSLLPSLIVAFVSCYAILSCIVEFLFSLVASLLLHMKSGGAKSFLKGGCAFHTDAIMEQGCFPCV